MREVEGKLRHQHCKNQNGRERERERERGRRLRTVLALPSRSLHLEAGPSIGCSQGHDVWHDGGRSPQPARVTAEPGARRRPLPARITLAAGARSRRAYHEPAAGHGGGRSLQPARAGHGGARNPQRAPGGNREQGGDAILSADGWIGRRGRRAGKAGGVIGGRNWTRCASGYGGGRGDKRKKQGFVAEIFSLMVF